VKPYPRKVAMVASAAVESALVAQQKNRRLIVAPSQILAEETASVQAMLQGGKDEASSVFGQTGRTGR